MCYFLIKYFQQRKCLVNMLPCGSNKLFQIWNNLFFSVYLHSHINLLKSTLGTFLLFNLQWEKTKTCNEIWDLWAPNIFSNYQVHMALEVGTSKLGNDIVSDVATKVEQYLVSIIKVEGTNWQFESSRLYQVIGQFLVSTYQKVQVHNLIILSTSKCCLVFKILHGHFPFIFNSLWNRVAFFPW